MAFKRAETTAKLESYRWKICFINVNRDISR